MAGEHILIILLPKDIVEKIYHAFEIISSIKNITYNNNFNSIFEKKILVMFGIIFEKLKTTFKV